MATNSIFFEQIVTQAVQLSFDERLHLMHWLINTLRLPQEKEQHQHLAYGQFRGAQMSTEGDFRLAEWRPTEGELNGAQAHIGYPRSGLVSGSDV